MDQTSSASILSLVRSMLSWVIHPSKLQGTIHIPPSKSQSIRAVLFAALAKGTSVIDNLLQSPDVDAMLTACAHLGAEITKEGSRVSIRGVSGKITDAEDVIQAGNSGLVLRLIGGVAGLGSRPMVITGDASIRRSRPVFPLLDALSGLGAEAISLRAGGGAPILIRGPIHPGSVTMAGEDSQPVSAMLIACAFNSGPTEIHVTNPGEKPWINLTLHWLKRLGIAYKAFGFEKYSLEGKSSIDAFEYSVPADLSSLTYPLLGALLTGSELRIDHLDFTDPQGDVRVISLLQEMGAEIILDAHSLHVKKCSGLKGISIDINDCVDALPLLAVAGCFAEGKTVLTGAEIARKKESDRIYCIAKELRKMGAQIEEHPDGLTIYRSSLQGAVLDSCEDHRIALSLAMAALAAKGESRLDNVFCVNKTFSCFAQSMQKLSANIKII